MCKYDIYILFFISSALNKKRAAFGEPPIPGIGWLQSFSIYFLASANEISDHAYG